MHRSQHLTSSNPCLAITDQGPWCEFMAEPGRPYCADHFKERVKVLPRCPALPRVASFEEVANLLGYFTEDQRALIFCPEPPFESCGAGDCRVGGSCGVDLNRETRRSRWINARVRHNKEMAKIGGAAC